MNNQEAFDRVARHLHGMTEQAVSPDDGFHIVRTSCSYWTEDGKTCAAGCLLESDEERQRIQAAFKNKGITIIAADDETTQQQLDGCDIRFIQDLQYCHDNPSNWKAGVGYAAWWRLQKLAAANELSAQVLEELGVVS